MQRRGRAEVLPRHVSCQSWLLYKGGHLVDGHLKQSVDRLQQRQSILRQVLHRLLVSHLRVNHRLLLSLVGLPLLGFLLDEHTLRQFFFLANTRKLRLFALLLHRVAFVVCLLPACLLPLAFLLFFEATDNGVFHFQPISLGE